MKRTIDAPVMVAKGQSKSVTKCGTLNLEPGSYPAVAGADIVAGASGGVIYEGKVYTAINHSLCNVNMGDPVGLHVSPNCDAVFIPCNCNCETPPTPAFCDALYAICINGEVRLMSATEAGNTQVWDLTGCCDPHPCPVTTVSVTLTCDPITETVEWLVEWGTQSATGDFSVLPKLQILGNTCTDPFSTPPWQLSICAFTFVAAATAEGAAALCGSPCGPVSEPAPSECCAQSLYFCLNGVSQLLAVDGGTYTWDVSACCNTTASLEVTLACTEDPDVITLSWEYTAGVVTASGVENTLMSQFCDDGDPRIITFDTAPCFLQLLVSKVQFECPECLFGDTEGTSPPVTPP